MLSKGHTAQPVIVLINRGQTNKHLSASTAVSAGQYCEVYSTACRNKSCNKSSAISTTYDSYIGLVVNGWMRTVLLTYSALKLPLEKTFFELVEHDAYNNEPINYRSYCSSIIRVIFLSTEEWI